MNLKTVKVLLFTLFSLALASLIIGCGVSKPVYFLFTALFAIGYAAVSICCVGAAPSAANVLAAATVRFARTAAKVCLLPTAIRPADVPSAGAALEKEAPASRYTDQIGAMRTYGATSVCAHCAIRIAFTG